MRVLIAFESSGVVREAFRRLGHDAWSCDLQQADDGSEHHIQGDVMRILDAGWDLMIAHPPCTYLTSSAAWAFGDGPYHQKVSPETLVGAARREAREEALRMVQALLEAPIKRIAIENPSGSIGTRIRKADQYIQAYDFGEDASKKTGLWLKGLDPIKGEHYVQPRWVCCGMTLPDGVGRYGCPNCCGDETPKPRWANQTQSGQSNLGPAKDRWKVRSKTYQGIADAMAKHWG